MEKPAKTSPLKRKPRESGRKYCYDHPHPAVSVDMILFNVSGNRIEVLLIKRKHPPFEGRWAFPGGFVEPDEPLEDAARRELVEETGVTGIRLDQFRAFGDPGRDPRGHNVSIVFTALLDDKPSAVAADDAAEAGWHSARRPPRLAFDHNEILRLALKHVFGKSQR
jgi:8-oxo-dGTP diphosphatase